MTLKALRHPLLQLILLSCVTSYLLGLSWTVLPSISPILTSNGLSLATYGELNLFLVFSAGLTTLAVYKFGDPQVTLQFFRRGLLLLALANALFLHSATLFPAMLALGIAIALILSGLGAIFPLLKQTISPSLLAGVFACVNLGSMSGPFFFRLWGASAEWEGLVALYALAALSCWGLALRLKHIPIPTLPGGSLSLRAFFRSIVCLYALILFLYAWLDISISAYLQLYLTQVHQFGLQTARSYLSLFWATVGFSQLFITFLSRSLSPRLIYFSLSLFLVLGYLLLNYVPAALPYAIFSLGLGCSAFIALTISMAEWDHPHAPKHVSAILVFAYFFGAGCASLTLGKIAFALSYQLMLGIALTLAALMAATLKRS